jgi:Predicted oxidoreductases of the aldo/keto reductase family
MQYRKDKYGNELSVLGYGCMRFTKTAGIIDLDKAEKEVMAAIRAGVNYFDTAFIYPGSEVALGKILERNGVRDKVNIATKLPQYLVQRSAAFDMYFDEELKRLRTDHVDYYLMHQMSDYAQWEKLKGLGLVEWIEAKKKSGAIRNIGFSYHGTPGHFLKILAAYDWDFCQIQYNYRDENTQAGVTGLRAAAERGIPVVIMEPLRGGKLVSLLPEPAKKLMARNPRGWTPAEWAFRWLYNQPEVTVVLSGMNSLEMVEENVRTASEARVGEFTDDDFFLIGDVVKEIQQREKVGCTGCAYCMPCPQGVDIPTIFRCYNTMYTERKQAGRFQYVLSASFTQNPAFATQCIGCGKCEKHCPQAIPIREKLKEADKALRPLHYRIFTAIVRGNMYRKIRRKEKQEKPA